MVFLKGPGLFDIYLDEMIIEIKNNRVMEDY